MAGIWNWLAAHWGLITSIGTVIGLVVGYFVGLWKSKADIELAKAQTKKLTLEFEQLQLNIETKSVAQMVLILTDCRKRDAGTQNLAFDFDDLWRDIGEPHALRLHAAINMLVSEGRAKRADWPNGWIFT